MYKREAAVLLLAGALAVGGCSNNSGGKATHSATHGSAQPTKAATTAPAQGTAKPTAIKPIASSTVAVQVTSRATMPVVTPTVPALTSLTATAPMMRPTGTAVMSSVSTYTSDKSGISFTYPDNWKLNPNGSTQHNAGASAFEQIELAAPDHQSEIIISTYQLGRVISDPHSSALKRQLDDLFDSLASQINGKVVSSKPYTGPNLQGFEFLIRRNDNSKEYHVYSLFKANRQYNVQLEATPPMQKMYDPVLQRVLLSLKVPSKPVPTPTQSGPANVGSKGQYISSKYGFRFRYPKIWTVQYARTEELPGNYIEITKIASPDGDGLLFFKAVQLNRSIDMRAEGGIVKRAIEQKLHESLAAYSNVKVRSRNFKRGDLLGVRFTIDYTSNGQRLRDEQVNIITGDRQYVLELMSTKVEASRFENALSRMIKSFSPGPSKDDNVT